MIRVLVVDDDPLVRSGLAMMLGGAADIEVAGEAADGADVVDAVHRHRPHVVLMDVRMPVLDGLAATAALHARTAQGAAEQPGPAVVMLTTFDADDTVLAALRAGAAGFLLKHTPPAEIVEAVRRAAAGEPVLSPSVTRTVIAMAAGSTSDGGANHARTRIALLTEREREVAHAVSEGLGNAEIAERLHLSMSSIKATISSALTRLDLTNRIQLAILAHESRR